MPYEEGNITKSLVKDVRSSIPELCCCCVVNNLFLCCLPTFVTSLEIVVLIMQGDGAFNNDWIITDKAGSSQDFDFNHKVVATIQLVVFVCLAVILAVIFVTACRLFCLDNDGAEPVKRVCFIFSIPSANLVLGVLGIVGCMLVTGSEHKMGISFYICLSASLIQIILLPIILMCYLCMRRDYIGVRDNTYRTFRD